MSDHPITPPPELVQQWINEEGGLTAGHIATRAAQWGADQELEACCGLLVQQGFDLVDYLHAARRPKPPSLKEQALGAMGRFTTNAHTHADEMMRDFDIIRRALEQLDD
jgi:hypothetical protein